MKKETKLIRKQIKKTVHKEHSAPLFLTSSFLFDNAEHARELFADEVDGNIYSRYSNPNTDEFVSKMADLENAEDGFVNAPGPLQKLPPTLGLSLVFQKGPEQTKLRWRQIHLRAIQPDLMGVHVQGDRACA